MSSSLGEDPQTRILSGLMARLSPVRSVFEHDGEDQDRAAAVLVRAPAYPG